jgi:hypothetical protein
MYPVRSLAVGADPGVLGAGVERGPGQVEPDRMSGRVEGLGLEPGEQAQGLGVALEAAEVLAELGQDPLAVVPERRMAEVVGERRGLGDVGVAAKCAGQVAGHLGDFEAVGEPVADEIVGLRADHLGLGGETPGRRGVHDPSPVAFEGVALGCGDPFGWLVDHAFAGRGVVELEGVIHRE